MPKIVAVLGMPGGGKSEAIEYLMTKYQWPKIYFAQPTFDEMERRGLERNQANERLVREDLRNLHGDDYYAREAVKKVEALLDAEVILLESFYSAPEYRVFKDRFKDDFLTIAIHTRPSIRHQRLLTRPERPLTLQESEERDWAQLNRLTQGTPIALADFMIVNEGEISELHAALDRAVGRIGQS
ncbi:MAG: AAA family ATPase [Candidatus Moraniibacteriota bacterium]|nr:MAG: AAA family ATPase [Candidatus Moranbacteria bacterium]